MLKLRPEQIRSFRKAAVHRFVRRMMGRLRQIYPQETSGLTEQELESLVTQGVEKAAGYGAVMESEFETYVRCMIQYGPDFVNDPETAWARDYLVVAALSATQRFAALRRCASLKEESL